MLSLNEADWDLISPKCFPPYPGLWNWSDPSFSKESPSLSLFFSISFVVKHTNPLSTLSEFFALVSITWMPVFSWKFLISCSDTCLSSTRSHLFAKTTITVSSGAHFLTSSNQLETLLKDSLFVRSNTTIIPSAPL